MLYAFILGTNHSLCKAEILTILKNRDISIIEASSETLILDLKEEIDARELINKLGSTAKIVRILDKPVESISELRIMNNESWGKGTDKFILFGVSVYNAGGKFKELNNLWYQAPKIANQIKDLLPKAGIIPLRERKLSTVSVDKNKLLTEGFELCLFSGKKETYFGKTLAVQDYEGYSKRDFGRPGRDSHSGMLPPKLAKMMINFSGIIVSSTILDPFCGSGTILQEAVLLGYKNIIGSDFSNKAVSDTQTNLDWLFKNFPKLSKNDFKINIFQTDVSVLSSKITPQYIDAIVTEPYLGPGNINRLPFPQLEKEINKIETLYLSFFREAKKVLKTQGKIVIVLPVFKTGKTFKYLNILKEIEKIGFVQENFLPAEFEKDKGLLSLELTDRNSILYYRPDQFVLREVFIFHS